MMRILVPVPLRLVAAWRLGTWHVDEKQRRCRSRVGGLKNYLDMHTMGDSQSFSCFPVYSEMQYGRD